VLVEVKVGKQWSSVTAAAGSESTCLASPPGEACLPRAGVLHACLQDTTHPENPLLTDEAAQSGKPTLKDDVIATCEKLGFEVG